MKKAARPLGTPSVTSPHPPGVGRLPHVQAIRKPDGRVYLYYRRDGRRTALPGPEGSLAFLAAYDRIHAATEAGPVRPKASADCTVEEAITAYLGAADFAQLAPATQRHYRHSLDPFRAKFGAMRLSHLDPGWWNALRAKYGERPADWNRLHAHMRLVIAHHRALHPGAMPVSPMAEIKRIKIKGKSTQNKAWPRSVLLAVLKEATPEFRALLFCYLLTAQRGGDVTAMRPSAYDPDARLLSFTQEKTNKDMVLHVPDALAAVFETMKGRDPERLLVTPRGKPWTLSNAQEMLRRMLERLGLPRFTLHGLRATGPTALTLAGVPNRTGRSLTGHDDDATYEAYTSGAAGYDLAKQAADKLVDIFGGILSEAEAVGNRTKASGLTGRAAAKAKSALATKVATGNIDPMPMLRKAL